MSIQGDAAREDAAQFFCKIIKEKIVEHQKSKETIGVLKEVGKKVLDELLNNVPEWSREYYRLFVGLSDSGIIAEALVKAGIPHKTVIIKIDQKIEKEVRDFIMAIEKAHQKAGKSKLHFP
jgi:hypothetical protein